MKKRQRLLSLLLCFILICITPVSDALFKSTVSAAATQMGYVDATDVHVRVQPVNGASLGKLSKVYVTINGSTKGSDGYVWYNITYGNITGYMRSDFIKLVEITEDPTFDEQLSGFPESYKASLRALHEIYPNSIFIADKVSMDLSTAVTNEYGLKAVQLKGHPVSWRSMGNGHYNWSTGTWNENIDTGWTYASKEIVAYYMDPRNFLDQKNIFMFLLQSYDPSLHTEEGLIEIVKGTFLEKGYSDSADTAYGGSYIKVIMEAARQSGVSPYIIASTILQEQGTEGTTTMISGTSAHGKYFNFFNFGAYGSDATAAGLAFAKTQGWNTRSKAIIGGAIRYGSDYIAKGQDTYFYMNFNIGSKTTYALYSHQYASNVEDTYKKAAYMSDEYSSKRLAKNVFSIPVYTSMPTVVSPYPEKSDKKNNYYLTSLKVSGLSPAFTMYNQSYKLSVNGDTTVEYSVPSGASVISSKTKALTAGSNTFDIIVRSESGYSNIYKLTVTASKACTLTLKLAGSDSGGTTEPDTPDTPSTPSTPTQLNGDINSDGAINAVDLAAIKMHILSVAKLTGNKFSYADINKDGSINALDLAAVKMDILNIKKINQ